MDIVEELEESASGWDDCGPSYFPNSDMERRAASEITRLREENKRMREAIGIISQRMEALEDESFEGLSAEATEHAAGFWRGQKSAAKSLILHLHDMTRAALATTGGE